ncbi:Sec-independent protein translocase protein TatB [Phyllobacterium leguminum]|uniref:Sec-independent protein translocase protein TatB n=1 Tax=Phyllobacterium leguminum TaxID=314237 RepID=A0A318T4J1_9HYPH|nr:Sec-independent protein translocase protein TatB [Phyllobacterium leguminum]PYE89712.1 sec-independent protein translocase protein TatB [Phyllobacterium leguminum]
MLDVGWSEILVIAIVIIVVVGPKDLPKMLRAFGKATARMRKTADEFRRQFDEALRETELEDVKGVIDDARRLDPRTDIRKVFDPIRSAGEELRLSLNKAALAESTLVPPPPPEMADSPPPPEPAPPVAAPTTAITAPEITAIAAPVVAAEPVAAEKPVAPVKKRKAKIKADGPEA